MKPIRDYLQRGKLYCLTYAGFNQELKKTGKLIKAGEPIMFLEYQGSDNLDKDRFKFLTENKVEIIQFGVVNHIIRRNIQKYIIPLHEWKEYLTFYNEYYKEVGVPECMDI